MYKKIGKYIQAKELNEKALIIMTKKVSVKILPSQPQATETWHRGTTPKEKTISLTELTIWKKIFGGGHVGITACYNRLVTSVYANMGKYNQANKALIVRKMFLAKSAVC